jgi:hypothetical protein
LREASLVSSTDGNPGHQERNVEIDLENADFEPITLRYRGVGGLRGVGLLKKHEKWSFLPKMAKIVKMAKNPVFTPPRGGSKTPFLGVQITWQKRVQGRHSPFSFLRCGQEKKPLIRVKMVIFGHF